MDITIDTTGFTCPQPMLMVKNVLSKKTEGTITVLADCEASKENITRIATQYGWNVFVEQKDDVNFILIVTK